MPKQQAIMHHPRLSVQNSTRVMILETACRWLEEQATPTACFAQAAVEASARLAGVPGPAGRKVSAGTMRRLYYSWKAAGRSRQGLVDMRLSEVNRVKVRTAQPAFRAHLAMLATKHKRSGVQAIKELYAAWKECRSIPGYEGLNYQPNMPLPAGWSVDNLQRLMPDKAALKMTREGVRAASAMLPQVFSTRAGGWPLSRVMFDDVWLDCLVQGYGPDGRVAVGRPLQLGALDYYTGKRISWFTKIRAKAQDGHSLQLTEEEMMFMLCDYLMNVGYSRRGTVLVCEHGTAAISKDVENALATLSDGCIKVDRSGLTGVQQVGAFHGRAVGNPRAKAALESWHNLLHNSMDGSLTQVGKDRREPEALHGIRAAAEKLAAAGEKLPPEMALALSPYAPTLAELGDMLARVVMGINSRTDHDLEGWAECGFTTLEVSLNARDNWQRLDTLNEQARAMVQVMAQQVPGMLRQRKMSPLEAWDHAYDAADVVRFTPTDCLVLMGCKAKFKLTPRGGAFALSSTKRHHRQLLFETAVITDEGFRRELPAGGEYYGVLNPLSEALFVLDDRDRVLGMAQPMKRFSHVDEAAKLREFGRVVHRRAEELARVEHMVADQTAELATRQAYNADVLAGRGVDPLAVADRRRQKRLAAGAEAAQEKAALAYTPAAPQGTGLDEGYIENEFPFS